MLFRRPLSTALLKINTTPPGALYRKVINNILELDEKLALSVLEPNLAEAISSFKNKKVFVKADDPAMQEAIQVAEIIRENKFTSDDGSQKNRDSLLSETYSTFSAYLFQTSLSPREKKDEINQYLDIALSLDPENEKAQDLKASMHYYFPVKSS